MARRRTSVPLGADIEAATKDADDLELEALRNGSADCIRGLFDDRLLSLSETLDPPGDADDNEGIVNAETDEIDLDCKVDDANASQLHEIERRSRLLGSAYPFHLESGTLQYLGSQCLVYEFCLAASAAPNLTVGLFGEIPRMFEQLVGRLLSANIGNNAAWYRLGWPPFRGDRPTKTREAIAEIYRLTSEWEWGPHPDLEDHEGHLRDGGIDVVVWKRFDAHRTGALFVLVQCACGNNWRGKTNQLNFEVFRMKWLKRMCLVHPPIRSMALPFHIADPATFAACLSEAGLLLDRTRLALLAAEASQSLQAELRAPLSRMISLVVPEFQPASA